MRAEYVHVPESIHSFFPAIRHSGSFCSMLQYHVNATILETKLEEIINGYPKVSGQQAYLSSTTNTILQNAEKELPEFKDQYIAVEH